MSNEVNAEQRVPGWAWGVALGFAVAVLGVGGVVIWNGSTTGEAAAAKQLAQEYVDAIADGDAATANDLARLRKGDSQNAVLFSDALSEAEHISEPRLRGMRLSSDGRRGETEVTYLLDGEKYRDSIVVRQDGDEWYVSDGLDVSPMVQDLYSPLRVAGFDEVMFGGNLRAYPGVYEVLPPNEFFEAGADPIVVAPFEWPRYGGDSYGEEDYAMPTDAYWDEIQRQSDERFDACARETGYDELAACGIYVELLPGIDERDAEIEVEILEYPVIEEWYDWEYISYSEYGYFEATVVDAETDERNDSVYAEFGGGDIYVSLTSRGELQLDFSSY